MGSIYTFWRTLYKDQKQAKQRYIDTFYNLEFRNLVYFCMPALHSTPNILMRYTFLILLPKLHLLQIKDVPIKIDEKTEGPKERPERVKVKPQLSQRYALELLPTIFQGSQNILVVNQNHTATVLMYAIFSMVPGAHNQGCRSKILYNCYCMDHGCVYFFYPPSPFEEVTNDLKCHTAGCLDHRTASHDTCSLIVNHNTQIKSVIFFFKCDL